MNGLGAAIKRQVQPCYELGALGGTPAMSIVTVLHLRFNPDGSVAGLRARGGYEVDIAWRGGRLTRATVRSVAGSGVARVRYGARSVELRLQPGQSRTLGVDQL